MDKIDRDANGKITKEELKSWIQYTQRRYIMEDVDRQWNSHNPDNKESIKWEDYKKMVYGFMDGLEPSELDSNSDEGFSYKDMIKRDERRWGIADSNGDHALDKVRPIKLCFISNALHFFYYSCRKSLPTFCIRKTLRI